MFSSYAIYSEAQGHDWVAALSLRCAGIHVVKWPQQGMLLQIASLGLVIFLHC